MMSVAFGICLLLSVCIFIHMAQKNYNNIDIYYWTIVVFVPIILLAYWLKTMVTTVEGAKLLFCFIYLDSTFILAVLLFAMLHALGIIAKPWLKILVYGIALVHMAVICLCVHNNLYYKTLEIVDTGIGMATKMTPGPLMKFHVIYLVIVLMALVAVLVVSFLRRGTYSRRNLTLYASVVGLGISVYVIELLNDMDFSLLPFLYIIGDFVIAIDYDYAHTHDISCLISEQQNYHGTRGYLAIGLRRQFLSCNYKCLEFFPQFEYQRVDSKIQKSVATNELIYETIDNYEKKGKTSTKFQMGNMTCVCEISHFSIRRDGKKQGYLLDIRDATEEQKNHDIIASYNKTLNAEIIAKTENIKGIQRKVVMGMADMIENRDDNTGGHVKRTSAVIAIITHEIRKQHTFDIDDQMEDYIIRSAPTHDLGKVVIDSNILTKQGKLTDEEYAIMKSHAVKSGEIVNILLDGIEEPAFVKIAYNLARHHHERWDGKGYPDGLVGNMIPLEARIMAVADVYDALVSVRCYKEPISIEDANRIILENMGTQFDPRLKEVFEGCKGELEKYYMAEQRSGLPEKKSEEA
ncbi:MAG: HD domain-containing protein [Clostridia bacterium]|nr:HD domain-containing protein [Clostridia bacterium]